MSHNRSQNCELFGFQGGSQGRPFALRSLQVTIPFFNAHFKSDVDTPDDGKVKAIQILDDLSGRISQMTYQPKSVGKMADFEILTIYISRNSSQMYVYLFLPGRSYKVLSAHGRKFDSQPSPVFKLISDGARLPKKTKTLHVFQSDRHWHPIGWLHWPRLSAYDPKELSQN